MKKISSMWQTPTSLLTMEGGEIGDQDTHQPYLQIALCIIMPHANTVLPSVMWSKRKFTRQKLSLNCKHVWMPI